MDMRWNFECIVFLKEIAKGFNPITGEKISEADILRSCDYVGRLEDLVRELEKDFHIMQSFSNSDKSQENSKPLSERIEVKDGLTISQIAENINKELPLGKTKITKKITKFLLDEGYLEYEPNPLQGKASRKIATKKGEAIGINSSLKNYSHGREYVIITYSLQAQKIIINHIPKIFND